MNRRNIHYCYSSKQSCSANTEFIAYMITYGLSAAARLVGLLYTHSVAALLHTPSIVNYKQI